MKAIKIEKNGGPEVLKIKEITLGKPSNDEVLIEHVAIGLNYIDTYHRSGLSPLMMPSGLGLEASGIIKEIGSNVSNFSIGDKNHDKINNSTFIVLAKGEKLNIKSLIKSKFLLVSGKPIGEPIARGGPFVMNTKEEILEAIQDYQNGTFAR